MINSGGDTSNNLVTGLFRRLIDLALQDDLLALDAAGLAAAVEVVDLAQPLRQLKAVRFIGGLQELVGDRQPHSCRNCW